MPKPFDARHSYHLRPDALSLRPKLACYIIEIITRSTSIEVLLGAIVSRMVGSSPLVGARIYSEARSARMQRKIVESASAQILSAEKHDELKRILDSAESCGRLRNNVVHAVWGFSEYYPNCLIYCHTKHVIEQFALQTDIWLHGASTPEVPFQKADTASHPRRLFLYDRNDFIFILSRQDKLLAQLGYFLMDFDKLYWEGMARLSSTLAKIAIQSEPEVH